MKTPFDDRVFARIAWVHGLTERALGPIGTGVTWKLTPIFEMLTPRYVEGLPREMPGFQFVWYDKDADPTLEVEIRTGGRGAQAIEYVHNVQGVQILLLRDRTLPETVRSSLSGRPLSDLVRHHWIPESEMLSVESIHEGQDLKILLGPMPGD